MRSAVKRAAEFFSLWRNSNILLDRAVDGGKEFWVMACDLMPVWSFLLTTGSSYDLYS